MVAIFGIAASLPSFGQALPPVQTVPGGPSYFNGEVLLQFENDATDQQIRDAFQRGALAVKKNLHTPAMRHAGESGILLATTTLPVTQALEGVSHLPGVKFAQPNWVYSHQAAPAFRFDDPFYLDGSLWGMGDGFGSNAAQSWNAGFTGSDTVYVGVIDEGLQFNHPDLAANIWTNPDEVPDNGIDDDGDGYVDDVHGWNAVGNNGNIFDPASDDHGTHVSGTIGGVGANGSGVAGVNWKVKIISGKFLGPNGGSTTDAIEAIDYMTALKTVKGLNIVALNNSWGGGGFDQALLDAIGRAAKANILFIAAAGNGNQIGMAINTDKSVNYPSCYNTSNAAGYDSVIAVTAIAKDGSKAAWANYGATTVDLGAPGVGILSTIPNGTYGQMDGTSMATPHVTGAVALYASAHPEATPVQIKDALLKSAAATPTSSLTGKTATGGRLNVPLFLNTPAAPATAPVVPAAPSAPADPSLAATGVSGTQIDLSWTDNSSDESGFRIQRSLDGQNWTTLAVVGSNRTAYSDKGLTRGTTYQYSITAYNSAGESSAFTASAQTDNTPPPPAPTVTFVTKDTTTKGNWIGKYGADGYNVILEKELYPAYVSVTPAGNNDWAWAASTTDTRGLQKPATPADRVAACWYSGGTLELDVNFSDGQVHTVAFYCVDWETTTRAFRMDIVNPADNTVVATQNVSAYNGGQYLVWNLGGHAIVRCTTTGGKNATISGIFFDTPPPAPDAPSNLSATAVSSSQIALNWSDNSAGESGFKLERSRDGASFTQIASVGAGVTSFTDTGLLASTSYTYRVRAYNSTGNSDYSSAVTVSTQAAPALPGAPTLGASAVSKSQINVSWNPNSAGGQTGFKVERSTDGRTFSQIASAAAAATSYLDAGLKANSTYYYRVRAFNTAGDGPYSNIANAKTPSR
jgi:thermitase